jgi:hypothetical protein
VGDELQCPVDRDRHVAEAECQQDRQQRARVDGVVGVALVKVVKLVAVEAVAADERTAAFRRETGLTPGAYFRSS